MKECKRCLMNDSVEEFIQNQDGTCNFCTDYFIQSAKEVHSDNIGQNRLLNLIGDLKAKRKSKKYDCLIGVSGGVDSSYVAYMVKKVYGLNPLAVHLDNSWNSELAVDNVTKLIKDLGIDLHTEVLDWKEFRDIQMSFLKSGISNIEIPTDHAIWAVMTKVAAKHGIKYIFTGANVVTESIMPKSWLYGSKDSMLIRSIQKQFGHVRLKTYPYLTKYDYFKYFVFKRIKWVPILNYMSFNKEEAKQFLIKELGWRDYGGKHYESIFTRFFHSWYLPTKFNIDLRRAYLSAEVCSGQISRDQALQILSSPPLDTELVERDLNFVAKKFSVSRQDLDLMIDQAGIKTHNHYSNDAMWWSRFGGVISKLRLWITSI